MKKFELSSRKTKNGRRKFKAILHEIYPESVVDTEKEVGTQHNINGITWQREYCEAALPTIKDMPIRVEYLDMDDKSEIHGHGFTGIDDVDNIPLFDDAFPIGHFTNGYIDDVVLDDGELHTVCIGEGFIDEQSCHALVKQIIEDMKLGIDIQGSIEIMHDENNESIVYKYGYKDFGRIPMQFEYSGYAILSSAVPPSDKTAKLIELNNKEETRMGEQEIKAIVSQAIDEMNAHITEINEAKEECAKQISEMEAKVETVVAEQEAAVKAKEDIEAELNACKTELEECKAKCAELEECKGCLEKELNEAKAEAKRAEMNEAISKFSDEEKAFAKAEIEAFDAEPLTNEINSIVNKIYEGIGKSAKEEAEKVIAEQNSAKVEVEDIFSAIEETREVSKEIDIF